MDALEQYIRDHTSPEEELLHELDRETNLRVIQPRMLSGHIQGRLLEMLVRMLRPRRVLAVFDGERDLRELGHHAEKRRHPHPEHGAGAA